MTSEKKAAANRRNARRSTGPRTAAGRARSARNATRHGVLSESVVGGEEEQEAFSELLEALTRDYDPKTATEFLLVQRLAILAWRERRLAMSEAITLDKEQADSDRNATSYPPPIVAFSINAQILVGRYQTMLSNQISSVVRELLTLRHMREDEETKQIEDLNDGTR